MRSRAKTFASFLSTLPSRARGVVDVLLQDPVAPANLVDALDAWADKDPERVYLLFEKQRITYGEMRRRVRRRAATLSAAGVRRGDAVAIMMQNSPEFLVNAFAVARLGAVSSLINTALADAALEHALMQTSPRVIVAGRAELPAIRSALAKREASPPLLWEETRAGYGTEDVAGARELGALDAEPAPEPPHATTLGDDLYAYIFTSGTTGLPKAGKITHARAHTAAYGFGRFTLGLSDGDVLYVCLPLFHSSGFLIGAGSTVLTGSTLALARKLSVSRFWDDVCDYHATAFVYIGEVCRYLVNAPPHPRERSHELTRIVGNGMRPDVWKAFVDRFSPGLVHEFYGATEGNVNMTNLFGISGSVGRMPPIPWLDNAFLAKFDRDKEAPIRDARGLCVACKPGEVGELLGRIDPGRVTMRFDGYMGDSATDAKILRNVKEHGDAYFRSGDLLKKDWLGFYYFVDRIGDTFRWKGENVSTNEVADVCMQHPVVDLANVFGAEVPNADGRAGMAALYLKPGCHFEPQSFYDHVTKALPSYAAPAFVRLLGEASITATFKLKKTDLMRDGIDPHATSDPLFYRNDRQRTFEPLDEEAYRALQRGELKV